MFLTIDRLPHVYGNSTKFCRLAVFPFLSLAIAGSVRNTICRTYIESEIKREGYMGILNVVSLLSGLALFLYGITLMATC